MTLGRVFGWLLVVVAALTASAEAVVALGTGSYESIATIDLWTLLTGHAPDINDAAANWADTAHALLLAMPAWIAIGGLGVIMVFGCRPRRRRAEYRETSMRFSTN
jgi:hypothetical protein